jgi:hypothetical protein
MKPMRQTQTVDARTAVKIMRDELKRIDAMTLIIGVYWKGGYRTVHLSPQAARELFRCFKMEIEYK